MRYLILALAVVAAPAAAADQFDLVCSGGPNATRYRIDLTRGEACEASCDRTWKMGEATTGELRVIYKKPTLPDDLEETATVNRVTGVYKYYARIGRRPATSHEGKCEPQPFTGFPAAKF